MCKYNKSCDCDKCCHRCNINNRCNNNQYNEYNSYNPYDDKYLLWYLNKDRYYGNKYVGNNYLIFGYSDVIPNQSSFPRLGNYDYVRGVFGI